MASKVRGEKVPALCRLGATSSMSRQILSIEGSTVSCSACSVGRRLKPQRGFYLDLAELHRETGPVIVTRPLVFVVTGKNLPGFPDLEIQQRALPIVQIGIHAHRGRQLRGGLLYARAGAAHRDGPDIEIVSDQRNLVQHRV